MWWIETDCIFKFRVKLSLNLLFTRPFTSSGTGFFAQSLPLLTRVVDQLLLSLLLFHIFSFSLFALFKQSAISSLKADILKISFLHYIVGIDIEFDFKMFLLNIVLTDEQVEYVYVILPAPPPPKNLPNVFKGDEATML